MLKNRIALEIVAKGLGDMLNQFVFVGGTLRQNLKLFLALIGNTISTLTRAMILKILFIFWIIVMTFYRL